mmetsp:Transcript_23144/g.57228  ORF Transcript_23144/g.57228 Transcript_23144/m.57228 type:complete len:201 (-) Transcript_23144:150-752(-)
MPVEHAAILPGELLKQVVECFPLSEVCADLLATSVTPLMQQILSISLVLQPIQNHLNRLSVFVQHHGRDDLLQGTGRHRIQVRPVIDSLQYVLDALGRWRPARPRRKCMSLLPPLIRPLERPLPRSVNKLSLSLPCVLLDGRLIDLVKQRSVCDGVGSVKESPAFWPSMDRVIPEVVILHPVKRLVFEQMSAGEEKTRNG